MVSVDGITYEYLGMGSTTIPRLPNLQPAKPQTVRYDSQYSNFTFAAGPVEITASFLSSVLPKDLCRTSIPLSYLTTSVKSTDNADHDVQFYSDVNAAWTAFENNVTIQWDLYEGSEIITGSRAATGGPSSVYSWSVDNEPACTVNATYMSQVFVPPESLRFRRGYGRGSLGKLHVFNESHERQKIQLPKWLCWGPSVSIRDAARTARQGGCRLSAIRDSRASLRVCTRLWLDLFGFCQVHHRIDTTTNFLVSHKSRGRAAATLVESVLWRYPPDDRLPLQRL